MSGDTGPVEIARLKSTIELLRLQLTLATIALESAVKVYESKILKFEAECCRKVLHK